VFWILIGTNDFGNTWCNIDVVILGVLRVAEEIRIKRPDSTIVINSILPRSFDFREGLLFHKSRGNLKNPQPPLWKDIKRVNEQLEDYCRIHANVEFFNATDIFLLNPSAPDRKLRIDKNLMGDFLHPSALGYKLWGDQIVLKLDDLLKKI